VTAPTQTKPKSPSGQAAQAAAFRRPFVAGTRRVDKATYDVTKLQTTSAQTLDPFNINASGFLSGGYILVETTLAASTGAGTSVAFTTDGPWSVLGRVELLDVNSKPIIGPMTGWDLYVANKYGGYVYSADGEQSPVFTTTTGTGTAAGNFAFCLRLPVELVHRSALGSVINKNNVATFKLEMTLAAAADVYTVSPNTLPTCRVRVQQFGWADPNRTDAKGNPTDQNPPGVNTLQYWAKQTYPVNAGAINQRLLGIDSLVRNLVFQFYATTGGRTTGEVQWPDPFTLLYETMLPIQRIRAVWRHMVQEAFGYTAALDTAGGRDSGVFPEWYNQDFGLQPGAELTNQYLPVSSATALEFSGSMGVAGTVVLLVNKVVPANGNPLALVGR
jgi:hypothetical protein